MIDINNNSALVSILMPVKNAGIYLEECLESIIAQTYVNWELIAVNDHSEDASKTVLEHFSQLDSRIKVVDNLGVGIIDALHTAYGISKGRFITRMDADDKMSANKIQILSDQLKTVGQGYVSLGLVEYFSEANLGEGYKQYAIWLNGLISKGNNFDDLYQECVIPSPCWMLYREDLDKVGAFESKRYPEDYDLCFRFAENGLKCIPSNQILHYWRDHASRTSRVSEVYADNHFVDLKCHYFLKNHIDKNRSLMLWSAGSHAKKIAKNFIAKKLKFQWICNNPNKIGHTIYGIKLQNLEGINWNENPQIIVVVSNPNAKVMIKKELAQKGLQSMKDYFFFC